MLGGRVWITATAVGSGSAGVSSVAPVPASGRRSSAATPPSSEHRRPEPTSMLSVWVLQDLVRRCLAAAIPRTSPGILATSPAHRSAAAAPAGALPAPTPMTAVGHEMTERPLAAVGSTVWRCVRRTSLRLRASAELSLHSSRQTT